MNGLEIALIILVLIWSVIFVIITIAVLLIIFAIKRAINKANKILDDTEAIANKVDLPSKVVIASILAFMTKNTVGTIKGVISDMFKTKKSKS